MNPETKFCITTDTEGFHVDIEGKSMELMNLLANVISEDKEIEMMVTMALMAVHAKRKDEDGSLEEMIMGKGGDA